MPLFVTSKVYARAIPIPLILFILVADPLFALGKLLIKLP
jgi:hypothetical protein